MDETTVHPCNDRIDFLRLDPGSVTGEINHVVSEGGLEPPRPLVGH
jgi:hypothetical protein